MAEPPSSPPSLGSKAEDALAWYKAQYELLESELAEFRESSRELEQEMEKDIERAEKQERLLQERAEALSFEVEEWKRKYKESKSEASHAQATLEKEITTLREGTRSLALKLRDSEVANDDFERQARNTTSSLEDMESKFNQAVERNVLMEEEIRQGEQEREKLRIESQRLREEMSELKIEAEVMQDKIKKFEKSRHLSTLSSDLSIIDSPTFDRAHNASPDSLSSSPLVTTPPEAKSLADEPTGGLLDPPPSPPMSDASTPIPRPSLFSKSIGESAGNALRRPRLPSVDTSFAQRSRSIKPPSTGSRPSGSSRTSAAVGSAMRSSTSRQSTLRAGKIPTSTSLSHIRLLSQQMQRLEARVQSAKSKLSAPSSTQSHIARPPSGASIDAHTTAAMSSSLALRSRKRTTGSTASSSAAGDDTTPTSQYGISQYSANPYNTGHFNPSQFNSIQYGSTSKAGHMPRLSASGASGRNSFGVTTPTTSVTTTATTITTSSSGRGNESEMSRPSSRASRASSSSYARPPSRNEVTWHGHQTTRSSTVSGTRPPLMRPQSSLGGNLHSHSASLSRMDLEDEYASEYRTPSSRRGTYSTIDFRGVSGIPTPGSGIPTPGSAIPLPGGRRQSGVRRTSTSGINNHGGRISAVGYRKLGDLGETY